jgi:hypothetical protein
MLHRIKARFISDINGFYPRVVVKPDLASTLTNVLSGKDLTEDTLTSLSQGILNGLDIAASCSHSSCNVLRLEPYRASIKQTFSALTAAGVTPSDAQRVSWRLYQAAVNLINPLVRPIPPAGPTR